MRRLRASRSLVGLVVCTVALVMMVATPGVAGAVGLWSSPADIDATNTLYGMSCPSASFCVAVDSAGNAFTFNGTSWSSSAIDGGHSLFSVSCPTSSFCAAGDDAGNVLVYNGTSWSSTTIDSPHTLYAVSCLTASFCVAVDSSGNAFTYHGASWSSPTDVNGIDALHGVSCPSASFCAAGGNAGNAFTYDGTSWSSASNVDGANDFSAVSCPSTSFCAAVDNAGNALTYNGISWSSINIDGANVLNDVSCPSTSFCAAVDDAGNAFTYDGTSWSSASNVDGSATFHAVSCPSSSFCAAGDNAGNVLTYPSVTTTTSCGSKKCTATATSPSQSIVVVGAPSSTSASITLTVAPDVLSCPGFAYPSAVATLTDTGLVSGSSVTVTDTVAGLPSKKGVDVCYQPVGSSPPAPKLLAKCHGSRGFPCFKSFKEVGGSVVATLLLPAGDPRFHVGGLAPLVTGISPLSAAVGKKLTISGLNLAQVTSVAIGGTPARIIKTALTKVRVIVPANANGTVVVSSLAGKASSSSSFHSG